MTEETSFAALIARVRSGDNDAVMQVLDEYGSYIARATKMRLLSRRMRRVFETADIAQTVMKSFLVRIRDDENQWQINKPGDLVGLLVTMTDHKVVSKIRRESALRRGGDKAKKSLEPGIDVGDDKPTPDEIAMLKEEADRCWDLLSEEAKALYKLRYEKELAWDEIGRAFRSSGEASRKKLERYLADVREQVTRQSKG